MSRSGSRVLIYCFFVGEKSQYGYLEMPDALKNIPVIDFLKKICSTLAYKSNQYVLSHNLQKCQVLNLELDEAFPSLRATPV